jgi:predicted amidophosphoribosyltransferase
MAAQCPSCGAAVEDGADLCLECGEPMGDSPAAKLARAENVIRPPANAFAAPKPPPPVAAPKPPPVGASKPAAPVAAPKPPAPSPTSPARPSAKRKWATEEPEPLRCPGCGVKSHAERCPNCGNKMKHSDD